MPDPSYDDEETPNSFTNLRLDAIGVPPYSCRGATQSLQAISQAKQIKRTVNGGLRDISFDGFKKYSSTISCDDQEPPAFDGVWPGLQVIVDCISELSYKTLGGTPERNVVPGSSRTSGNYTIYRPQLTCLIVDFQVQRDEYGAATNWSLDLEEI